jgi:hypothetical protein
LKSFDKILKSILACAIVLVLLYKPFHYLFDSHHRNHILEQNTEKNFTKSSSLDHCDACDYEFAQYLVQQTFLHHFYSFFDNYKQVFSFKPSYLSFFSKNLFLRGPPEFS